MKTVFNIILSACIVLLIYICYTSIMEPVRFDEVRRLREKAVIARLTDIRKAQTEYRNRHGQRYTSSFDSLIDFIENARLPFVYKRGELTDEQIDNGLTETAAARFVEEARKTGDYTEIRRLGLENFARDTMWVNAKDTLFHEGYCADSLRYIPFGNGASFEMETRMSSTKSGTPFCLLEVRAPYHVYLNGLDRQEIANLTDRQTKLGKYCGLKIGDLETANNNAGNWE